MSKNLYGVLEVLDPSGHVEVRWDPDDPASVEQARAEFERLKAAGFAFFAEVQQPIDEAMWKTSGRLLGVLDGSRTEPQVERVKEFNPRRRRQTAVPPLVGG